METVVEKKIEEGYEAGSGTLNIPILGDLFPKVWGQEMKKIYKYYIFTEKYRYAVDEEVYNSLNIGDEFDSKLSIFG